MAQPDDATLAKATMKHHRTNDKKVQYEDAKTHETQVFDGWAVEVPVHKTARDVEHEHIIKTLNDPDQRVTTAPKCFASRPGGAALNVYGCNSVDNEVCHADICVSLTDISASELLAFLDTNKHEHFDRGYQYVHNSPTLTKLYEQIMYLSFTPPQLIFIGDYMQRRYTTTVPESELMRAVWMSRRLSPEEDSAAVPIAPVIGQLLVKDVKERGLAPKQFSLWRSPFDVPRAEQDKYDMSHCVREMQRYIRKTYNGYDVSKLMGAEGESVILKHAETAEPYTISGSSLETRKLYFRQYTPSKYLDPFHTSAMHLDYQCARRFIHDIVDVFGTEACLDVMTKISETCNVTGHLEALKTALAGVTKSDEYKSGIMNIIKHSTCNATPGVWREIAEAVDELIDRETTVDTLLRTDGENSEYGKFLQNQDVDLAIARERNAELVRALRDLRRFAAQDKGEDSKRKNIVTLLKDNFVEWSDDIIQKTDQLLYRGGSKSCNSDARAELQSDEIPMTSPSFLYRADFNAGMGVDGTAYYCPTNSIPLVGSSGACCAFPDPLAISDDGSAVPAFPSIWLNPRQYRNTDVGALYLWRKRCNWVSYCSEKSVASKEEVAALSQGIASFEFKHENQQRKEVKEQMMQHWEHSMLEYKRLWSDLKIHEASLNGVMVYLQNLHAAVGARVEAKLRTWLGTIAGTDVKKKQMYEDVTRVWTDEIDDRNQTYVPRSTAKVWRSTMGVVHSMRDATFNMLMLVIRSPSMFYPLMLAFRQLKRYLCAEISKTIAPLFDWQEYTDSPEADFTMRQDAKSWEIGKALMLALSGGAGGDAAWMQTMMKRIESGMKMANSGLKISLGVVGLGSFSDAARDGLYAIIEESITHCIHQNIGQLQMYYGTREIVNMLCEPCLQSVRIAGVRVIRRNGRGLRDGVRDWFWSMNTDPDLADLAKRDFTAYASRSLSKGAGIGGVVGLGLAVATGGGIVAVGAGTVLGLTGAAAATAFYGDGPSGDYVDIQTLARDVAIGKVPMFAEDSDVFVMWSDFADKRREQVKYAQAYFVKFLKQHITQIVDEHKGSMSPEWTSSVQYLVRLMEDPNRDFDKEIGEKLANDAKLQNSALDPFRAILRTYKNKPAASEEK